ncbi:hypothetical protein ACFU6G_41155, partial [Streptomyces sp. NPDC057494]
AGLEPASPYTVRVEDTALAGTVRGFLSAFLGADGADGPVGAVGAEGSVGRYLVPGMVLARPEARFAVVETVQVLSQGRPAGVGRDGATARVRAEVTATDMAGRSRPMAYVLTLTARDGRWEIASVDTGPAAAAAPRS